MDALTILMPVYDDWEAARFVIAQLDAVLAGPARVLIVDDGSQEAPPEPFLPNRLAHIAGVEVLRLRRNLGHQRAIAIGLTFFYAERQGGTIIVMDADGEDRPEDVPRLVERFQKLDGRKVVFAARMRRSEGWLFRVCYHTYRGLHWLLTGISVRVGNFSILSRGHLDALTVAPDLWNHYAATVLKTKLPCDLLPTARARRLAGQSKLNFVSMVVHGLSAVSVFVELVGARLSLAMLVVLGMLLGLLLGVVGIRLGTNLAIPGWATYAAGALFILIAQMLTVALGLTFLILFQRNSLNFLPVRDYKFFVGPIRTLYEQPS